MAGPLKPLTHWVIYKGYKLRYKTRSSQRVTGLLITPDGETEFDYDPHTMTIRLPDARVLINEHGWELDRSVIHNDKTERP